MTAVEFAACVTAVGMLAADRNPELKSNSWRQAIGHNICAAANAQRVDPRVIVAIILNENGGFRLGLHLPAARGYDVGICQANSHFQGHRRNMALAMHPYACAEIVAQVLRENADRFGWNWQAIAAYWNPRQAQQQTQQAHAYYARWRRNYSVASRYFEAAQPRPPSPQAAALAGSPSINEQE